MGGNKLKQTQHRAKLRTIQHALILIASQAAVRLLYCYTTDNSTNFHEKVLIKLLQDLQLAAI